MGGVTLVRHQLALALAAGSRRILCLARGIGPELIELQHEAERAGASFHVIAGAHGLSGLVTAADEVLVVTEGLLPTLADALRLMDSAATVLVQPAEIGIPAGFERIDLNSASAGLMLVPGRLVDRLMDLPPDSDPASALLRIALQAGIAQRPVPDEILHGGRWLLVRSETEAQDAENGWVVRHTAGVATTAGPLLARTLVRHYGSALLHGGNSGLVGTGTAALLGALGLALAWAGWSTPGLLLAGAGWTLHLASAMLERLRRETVGQPPRPALYDAVFELAFDAVIVAMLVLAAPALPGEAAAHRVFAPVMLVGLLRLLVRGSDGGWRAWAADRLAATVLLAALSLGGVLDTGVPLLAVLFLLAGLIAPIQSRRHELT